MSGCGLFPREVVLGLLGLVVDVRADSMILVWLGGHARVPITFTVVHLRLLELLLLVVDG